MRGEQTLEPGALRTVFLSIDRPELAHDVTELMRILAGRCDVTVVDAWPENMLETEAALEMAMREGEAQARFCHGGTYTEGQRPLDAMIASPPKNPREDSWEERDAVAHKRALRWAYKQAAYRAMRPQFSTATPWGCLTGIRPSKLLRSMVQSIGRKDALRQMGEDYDVSPEKQKLLLSILKRQAPILEGIVPEDVDLYIGIPFCRTRCQYCSFAAYALESQDGRRGVGEEKVDAYLEALEKDVRVNLRALRGAGYRIRSVYLGGGTPTSIGRGRLERLLALTLDEAGGYGLEFCVEAGRPDSMDEDLLRMLKGMGVTRLSINPQSMNQKTLDAIGRAHSPEDIETTFATARRLGFDDINMDIILGLPGEDLQDFAHTLNRIRGLAPEGLTVHALAVKRASRLREVLREDGQSVQLSREREASAMQALAAEMAEEMGLYPYYMYRQKYSAGNLENVGYAAAGKECIYNIDIMEECCSILALGAGAISKRHYPDGSLQRFANPKDLTTYGEKSGRLNDRRIALWKGQEA